MATAAVINTSGESYRSSSRSSYDSDEGTRLKSSVAVVSTRPPTKRVRNDDSQASIRNEGPRRKDEWVEKVDSPEPKKKKEEDILTTKTGGAYIPPARLRMMQEQIQDKSSVQYQRMAWEALKKSINGLINKVNVSNIKEIIRELFGENIIRGRGLLARSIITAQSASPTFSHVYGALVAVVNTKFPQTGELIAKRLIIQFQKGFRRNNKTLCLSSVRFIAHLINQQVLHELLALEILTLLLEDPTNDSVEVAIGFLKECGQMLTDIAPAGIHGVFESLKGILHDGSIDVRVQYMIEVMFAVRKDGFKEHPSVVEGLDLVDEGDQITHLLSLEEEHNGEDILNVFKPDSEYLDNEEKYKAIKEEILGSDDDESGSDEDSEEESDEEQTAQGEGEVGMNIVDETQTNLLELRRTIYLTIMSSLDFEECAHKIMKMSIKPGQEMEVANMIIECCSEERSYQRFYGLLGERFCHLNEMWVEKFDLAFQEQYSTVHRLETNKLRNAAKFFAQLFYTDALPWTSLACISMNEEDTNSSSRIFVKILFQELAEYMGLQKLNERLKDPFLAESFEGLMPRDNPRNTRFAINFFTSIGLGGLTDDLREHLKNAPKRIMEQQLEVDSSDDSSSEESSSGSDNDSSDDDSSSDDDTTSDEDSSESDTDSSLDRRRIEEKRRKMKESRNKDRRYTRSEEKMTRNIEHGGNKRSKGSRKESDDERRRRDSDSEQRRSSNKDRRRRHDSEDELGRRDSDNERKRKSNDERRRRHDSKDEHRRRDSDNEHKRKRDSNKERRRRHDSEDEHRGRDSGGERGRKRDSNKERRRRHDSEDERRGRDSDDERKRKRGSDDERRRNNDERRRRHDSDGEQRRKKMSYEDEQDRRSTKRYQDNGDDDTRHPRHRRRYSKERR